MLMIIPFSYFMPSISLWIVLSSDFDGNVSVVCKPSQSFLKTQLLQLLKSLQTVRLMLSGPWLWRTDTLDFSSGPELGHIASAGTFAAQQA